MFGVLIFMIAFVICYFIYYFIFDDMLKKEKYTKIKELVILTKNFNLDKKKLNYRKCLNGVAIINSFIISITMGVVVSLPLANIYKLLIAGVMIIVLIIGCYFAYGKYLNKKWGK